MTASILVTGGTGTLGRLVVERLRETGRDVRVLTRRELPAEDGVRYLTGDLATGAGVERALAGGIGTIVHCASAQRGDVETTRTLVRAASALPQAPHLVYVSIVGADRLTFGYTKAKLDAEQVVIESGLPWTIVRATQFFELILDGVRPLAKLPVVLAPAGVEVQPVDPRDVADHLVELAVAEPAGRVPDLGGPERLTFADLLRGYLLARGSRRPVVSVWLPGLGALRAGALLPQSTAMVGRRTWQDFLVERREVSASSG